MAGKRRSRSSKKVGTPYMSTIRYLTEDEGDKEFTFLVRDEQGASQAWDSVEQIVDANKSIEANRMWTYMDAYGGGVHIVAGVHHVNAFAYAVSEERHDFLTVIVLDSVE